MPTPGEWPTQDLVSHRVAATPDRTAVVDVDSGECLTYRALDTAVAERTAALDRLCDRGGPTVAVLLDTRVAFAEVVFAVQRLGGRLVPLNARLTPDELAAQVDRLDLDVLVCGSDTEATAVEVTDAPVATVDESEREAGLELRAPADAAPDPVSLDRESDALVMFTSGTTGQPKGVRLTIGNLLASATASAFRLGVDPTDRWLCCLPMYHMGGLAPVIRSVLYGTTVVVQSDFDAARTPRVVDEYTVTGVSLVPTMLQRLLDAGWTAPDQLRFVLLGGAPASAELVDRCAIAGVPVYPTYGMTETASQIATATPEQAFSHEGTVGQPLLGTDVTVVDEAGSPLPTGERGELVVDGPTVTPGYLDSTTTDDAFGEFGLHTGDVGYRDDDGRLWVLNRVDDRIISGGENVDPGEVADTLTSHPDVAAAAVVGLDDPEWGERVGALVVPAADESLDVDAVVAYCRGRLAGFKCPRTTAVAEELPRTASGTVDREAVRDRLR
ncbi:o-succinylbenzoate--CoA ligase [Halorientalis brevis]|uniref:O-succinylbenzoate--CoA ligase n=1 Tax=Halorientalis brevis TaxID=1126241 RepID=A0ABD6CCK9_9EURY|nr:o-succinylbenzoate--CoA ligase [Halorientalis brevis]